MSHVVERWLLLMLMTACIQFSSTQHENITIATNANNTNGKQNLSIVTWQTTAIASNSNSALIRLTGCHVHFS